MIIKKTFVLLFALAFLLLVSRASAAEGEANDTLPSEARIYLAVNENENQAAPGWTVGAFIENAPLIYGADIRLTFDAAVLEVVDADESQEGVQVAHGELLDATAGFVLRNKADNESGVINYVLALLNPAPPVAGDGLLTQVTFRAKGAGQTTVRIAKGQFGTQTGEVIDPTLVDDVTFDVVFNESTQTLEVAVEAPQAESEEALEGAPIGSESEASEAPSTTLILLLGLVGGSVVVLGGQFVLSRLRQRS